MKKTALKGFTLVELLIVIAIIAILAAIVVLIINPLELTRRGRDAARLSDLANLQQAINVAVQEATGSTNAILCVPGTANACTGKSTDASSQLANGTGWVKVNLGNQGAVSIGTLPKDPQDTTSNHYTYCADTGANGNVAGWIVIADLESAQQIPKEDTDGGTGTGSSGTGGNGAGKYEVGSDLSLLGKTMTGSVACAY